MEFETSGDSIEVRVPGQVLLAAEFLAEGYYQSDPEGDPPEEDLFQIEVRCLRPEEDFDPLTFPVLLPAVPVGDPDDEEPAEPLHWVRPYLVELAERLRDAPAVEWEAICEGSRGWAGG